MTAAFYQNETKFYVAVDCIILGFDQKELNVLLYKRKFEPMMGQWSLMGGFIKAGESIEEAASRVLTDCTGIDNLFMEQVGAYGDITRDLGERVISVAYYSLVNMNDFSSETLEEYNAVWAKVSEVPQLIFDHAAAPMGAAISMESPTPAKMVTSGVTRISTLVSLLTALPSSAATMAMISTASGPPAPPSALAE